MRLLNCVGLLLIAAQISGYESPYFSKESPEIESSEHGGPPGTKSTTCPCGWANKETKRIAGGKETKVNEYPFIVALVDRLRRVFCGGSILTTRHILTAAHCTIGFKKSGGWISVAAGEHDVTKYDDTYQTQLVHVKYIWIHENYDDILITNDISVLLLENELKFNQYVGSICLSPVRMNLDGQSVKIIGWGKMSHNATVTSDVLNQLNVRVVPLEKCAAVYGKYVVASRKAQICAHSFQKGSCKGDSGGPLVWLDPETNRYTQVGVVSFGRICGSVDPVVYTYTTAYWDWIQKIIDESTPAGKQLQICRKV